MSDLVVLCKPSDHHPVKPSDHHPVKPSPTHGPCLQVVRSRALASLLSDDDVLGSGSRPRPAHTFGPRSRELAALLSDTAPPLVSRAAQRPREGEERRQDQPDPSDVGPPRPAAEAGKGAGEAVGGTGAAATVDSPSPAVEGGDIDGGGSGDDSGRIHHQRKRRRSGESSFL